MLSRLQLHLYVEELHLEHTSLVVPGSVEMGGGDGGVGTIMQWLNRRIQSGAKYKQDVQTEVKQVS